MGLLRVPSPWLHWDVEGQGCSVPRPPGSVGNAGAGADPGAGPVQQPRELLAARMSFKGLLAWSSSLAARAASHAGCSPSSEPPAAAAALPPRFAFLDPPPGTRRGPRRPRGGPGTVFFPLLGLRRGSADPGSAVPDHRGPLYLFSHGCLHTEQRSVELPLAGSGGSCPGSWRLRMKAGSERQELSLHPGDSDRTEEDAEPPGEPLQSFPAEISLMERLGLHRAALTEQDVEAAFTHLALAFSCDAFTLRQRLEVEERARAAAEDNVQQELGQCQDALERLGRSCAAADAQQALEQLQRGLTVLAAAVARATSAAEKLGAVHQEARMGRAAEVMVQHVENLKRQHVREHAELEDMKRLIQQNSRNRQLGETQDEAEPRPRPHALTRSFPQASARRRVSIAVIPKQLLPGASPDGRAEPAREPGAPRSEKELRRRGAMSGEPVGSSGPGTEHEEPEQPELPPQVSLKELGRPWLFLPPHSTLLLWLLLLGLFFLFLIPMLELQKLHPAAAPKA